jgi:hypothetical protein
VSKVRMNMSVEQLVIFDIQPAPRYAMFTLSENPEY